MQRGIRKVYGNPPMLVRLLLLLPLFGLVAPATAFEAEQEKIPPELKKLHVLLAFDSDDPYLRESVLIDLWRMKRFIPENVPKDRFTLTVLAGKATTREGILNYYRDLKCQENEGLLFYYAGHGARDGNNRHYFRLTHGKNLYRDELLAAMTVKKAPLVVVITDCCSHLPSLDTRPELVGNRKVREIKPATTLSPTLRQLFFQARGLVDVTAATEDVAWGDREMGGVFTRSVCRMLKRSVKEMDSNQDGFLTWDEFFPQLQKDTELDFERWWRALRVRGEKTVNTSIQKPEAFRLGYEFAVVGIENATAKTLTYVVRWSEHEPWEKNELAPGEKQTHHVKKQADAALPTELSVRIEGIQEPLKLKAARWTGQNNPTYGDATRYRIRPQASDGKGENQARRER